MPTKSGTDTNSKKTCVRSQYSWQLSQSIWHSTDWLKIPAEVAQGAPLPDWSIEITSQALAPYVVISKAVGSIRTDPDVNSLVWQGP
jgi:hypothetical protein